MNLTGVRVVDDRNVTVSCGGQTTLAAGQSMTCTGSGVATVGQYKNVGTVTATWSGGTVTDSDASHYVGIAPGVPDAEDGQKVQLCHRTGNGSYHLIEVSVNAEPAHKAHGDGKIGDPVPADTTKIFDSDCRAVGAAVEIKKSTNGQDADEAPGPSMAVGSPVSWQYVVTNTGNMNLTGVRVVDDRNVTVSCGDQTMLAAGQSMTCTGSGVATVGQYKNVGTVTAAWSGGTVTDSDASHYVGIAPGVPDAENGQKVQLCHRTGNGSYHLIEVSVNAEPAHRAHGDGKIGEAVPNSPGKRFDATCSVQQGGGRPDLTTGLR